MKKQICIYLLLLIAPSKQLTAQTSWLWGGQTLGATQLLGSTDAKDVQLITNSTPVMTFKSSGNIGIGTTTPLSRLDVSGGTAIGSYAGANAAPTNGLIISGKLGTGLNNPAWQLDVSGGDANVGKSSAAYGYRINDTMALWLPNVAGGAFGYNTYVGRAGNNTSIPLYCTLIGFAAGRGITSSAPNNTFVGAFAGYNNTPAQGGTFVGYGAGYSNTIGDFNTFLGDLSGVKNTQGGNQVFVGYKAGNATTLGSQNVAVGSNALAGNTLGTYNTAIGSSALLTPTTYSFNTATGANALRSNTASNNSAFGYQALYNNNTGTPNDAFGYNSLTANTSGNNNVGFGYQTLYINQTGNNNTAIGNSAGSAINGGNNNTLLGYNTNTSGANAATLVDATAIGSGASVTTNSTMILGDNNISVGIGYSGTTITPNTKLDVLATGVAIAAGASSYASHNINSNIGNGTSISNTTVFGVYGESSGAGSAYTYNYGGVFEAKNAGHCIGVDGISVGSSNSSTSYAGYFNSSFSSTPGGISQGVTSFVGSNGSNNVAVYASAPSSSNNTLPNWAGYFINDVYITGNGWISAAWNIISDKKYKKNIDSITNPLTILKKLSPKTYYYDTANADGITFPKEKQYGFIAQEVQQILPELVKSVSKPVQVDADGNIIHPAIQHLGINYNNFIALLTAAMQAQQSKVDSLTANATKQDSLLAKQDSINKALQNQITQIVNTCCSNGTGNRTIQNSNANGNTADTKAVNAINVELNNKDVIVLNQNVPNPFAEQTVITYNIPQNTGFAQLLFYDANGRQIKSVDISTKGKGQLNVYANDLTNGMYSYTLIVDGKIIDTKRMVKQQ